MSNYYGDYVGLLKNSAPNPKSGAISDNTLKRYTLSTPRREDAHQVSPTSKYGDSAVPQQHVVHLSKVHAQFQKGVPALRSSQ